MSEWIDVKIDYPPCEDVLVFDKCGTIHVRHYIDGSHRHVEDCNALGNDFSGGDVYFTHWMTLPSPPKEKTEKKKPWQRERPANDNCSYCKNMVNEFFCLKCFYNYNACESHSIFDGITLCPKCHPNKITHAEFRNLYVADELNAIEKEKISRNLNMNNERYSIQVNKNEVLIHGYLSVKEILSFIEMYWKQGFDEVIPADENSCLRLKRSET